MNRRLFYLLFILLVFQSCERTVDIELDDINPKLVVEAIIENERPPVVYLTKTVNYFSEIDLDSLVNSFVHNAEVFVSNGLLTHKLKE